MLLATFMNTRKRYRKQLVTPRPERITTPEERGQAFRHWLETHAYSIDAFTADSGLGRQTIINLLSGKQDIASVRQETAEALLATMNVSDVWAWDFFAIPDENRANFHTFRPRPIGHGPDRRDLKPQYLESGLLGEVTAPGGAVAWYEAGVHHGLLLTRAGSRFYALASDAATGEVLGRLVSVDVATTPATPPPGHARLEN